MSGPIYAINGVPIHEGHTGWRVLRPGTNTQGGVTNAISKVASPGRPGYRPAPTTFSEQVIVLVVRTPRNRLDELLALCSAAATLTRVEDPTKELRVELSSAIPSSQAPLDAVHDVTITLSAYEGAWRDVDAVIFGPEGVTAPTQDFQLLDGISSPVFDGDIFLRGVFGEFVLTDSGGSTLRTTRAWPGTSTTGLLYVGSTKQAFLANESDPWTPVADRSGYIDMSAHSGFHLTPKLVSGNPAVRRVELSLTTLSQTSTTLRVRAKRAYRMN